MAVSEQTPYIEYTANGTATSFALEFDCDNRDHLIVLVDDVEPVVGAWSLSNGAVVFNTAPENGKKITLQRNTPFSRTTDYQSYNNSFRPPAVNKDFDWLWYKLQELGVIDWILGGRIDALRTYVDQQDDVLQQNIDNLKIYVDDKDDELRAYLLAEIQAQGVAQDQLETYYEYLMQRLAQIAVDKGWSADFVVDGKQTQKQINARTITPYDYGAIQNSSAPVSEWYTASAANYRGYANLAAVQADYPHVVDGTETIAWAALQKFFNVVTSGVRTTNLLVGNFYINKELNFTGNDIVAYDRNSVVNCDATLWDKSANGLEYILSFESAVQTTFNGILRGYGVGSSTYSSRKTKDIFLIKAGCSYSVFNVLAPQYAKRWGVSCLNVSTQLGFNYVKAAYCGTSYDTSYPLLGKKYTVSSIVNNGTANSLQSSVLTLTEPLDVVVEANDGHMYSGTADIPYEITEISADRLQVTVRPWVNPTHADAEWHLFVGGAVCTSGSDSSVHNFNYIDSLSCGIGYWAKSLYGANVGTLATQFNNIGWIPSRSMSDASGTGFISQIYCEGNYFNILIPNTGNWAVANILSPFTTRKVISYQYVDSSTYERATKSTLRGLQILNSSGKAINQVSGGMYQTAATTLSPHNDNTMPMLIKYRDTTTITLSEEESIASLTGKVGYILTAMGSGANNQPTGTWTFNPRSGSGWTVNGGTTYTLSGFTEATNILIYADYVNKNWIVKGMNLVPIKSGNVIYDPVSLTTGARTAISTITVTGAALGDKVAMAFSRDLQGVNLEGYVSAAATVSFYFENRTGATVDLASGTVSAKII